MYGLNSLDVKIFDFLTNKNVKNNFFIEAGANDGLMQSNTAILEFQYGWKGILIEPNKINFLRAKSNRPNSIVVEGALVCKSYEQKTIKGIFSDNSIDRFNGLCSGVTDYHLKEYPGWICEVNALKLSEILEEHKCPTNPGLLSLDVEGYELEALDGLDFSKFRPEVIVLEIAQWTENMILNQYLDFMNNAGYTFVKKFDTNGHDYLFIDAK